MTNINLFIDSFIFFLKYKKILPECNTFEEDLLKILEKDFEELADILAKNKKCGLSVEDLLKLKHNFNKKTFEEKISGTIEGNITKFIMNLLVLCRTYKIPITELMELYDKYMRYK